DGLDDVAMMRGYGVLDNLIMDGQPLEHAGFIAAHLAAKTHDIGEHDRSESARLSGSRVSAVLGHDGDYRASNGRLSNKQGACRWPAPSLRYSGKRREQRYARRPSRRRVPGLRRPGRPQCYLAAGDHKAARRGGSAAGAAPDATGTALPDFGQFP